jgi:DNA-directed RNA polymerase delta subunit
VDMVYDILNRSGAELHISEIIRRVEEVNGIRLDRESIASALSKKIKKGDRFLRVGKNTFTLRREVL